MMRAGTKKSLIRLAILAGLVGLGIVGMFSEFDLEQSLEMRFFGGDEKVSPAKVTEKPGGRHGTF